MPCQACGIEAPTQSVAFYQNIGLFLARRSASIKGNLCRRCISKYFKSYTLTTLFLGWWGLISFVITPFILLNNIARYIGALSLPGPGIQAMDTPLAATAVETGSDGSGKSFKFKIIYGIFAWCIALAIVLSSSWQFVDRHFPRLNKFFHSGSATSDSDVDYRVAHLTQDFDAYNKVVDTACPEGASFKDCRKSILAGRPILNDMKEQYDALLAGWSSEKNERTIPDSCREAMDSYESSLSAYWTIEDQALRLYEGVNPDSKESIKSALPRFEEVGHSEDAVIERLNKSSTNVSEVFSRAECQGY